MPCLLAVNGMNSFVGLLNARNVHRGISLESREHSISETSLCRTESVDLPVIYMIIMNRKDSPSLMILSIVFSRIEVMFIGLRTPPVLKEVLPCL